jgi:hypothetical protein
MRVLIAGSTTWTDCASIRREFSPSSSPGESWKGLNDRMLGTGIDVVLAFHANYGKPGHARGTHHAVDLAKAAGIETRVIIDHRQG